MSIVEKISAWNRARKRNARIGKYPFQLAVLGIMKNEGLNIDEWVQHYLDMGADKVFLIDNGSDDDSVAKALK